MSRYVISEDEHLEVVVGWDQPLGTFFCQVSDNTVADDEDECIIWLGAGQRELPLLESLRIALKAKGLPEIPPDVQDRLVADWETQWEPGPLQKLLGFVGKARVDGSA